VATACCTPLSTERRSANALVVALAGNPNVGKSTLFNRLTGSAVETANYPGMTVGLNVAAATWAGQEVQLVDLPGTYALDPVSEDQWVARHGLLDWRPDVVIAVVDATNLARNLYLVLQIVDLGPRVVIALNLIDEAHRLSLRIDPRALSQALGLPVIPTVARRGEGLDELVATAAEVATGSDGLGRGRAVRYSAAIEAQVADLEARLADTASAVTEGLPPRAAALALLEGDDELTAAFGPGSAIVASAERATLAVSIAAARHAAATAVAEACTEGRASAPAADRYWAATTSPLTGVPILLAVLASVFAFLFFVGGWLSSLLTSLWGATASPVLASAVHGLFGNGALAGTLLWGLDGGILAALAVGIPYILTFYFVLALLEDSGYMNAAAFLADRVMHLFGLHGRAVIPLMAAAGCNVPAIMGTRVLSTKRERTIACTLVVLVPCSARTAVILGSVSLFVGWQWALFVFGVLGLVGVAAGLALNRILPGEPEGLVMEMFPFRRPSLRLVAVKTWKRFGTFLWAAAPIMLIGSFALGALYETGLIWHLEWPLDPVVVGWLGLPAVAGLTLLLGVLRKELALQMLVVFAVARYGAGAYNLRTFMTAHQIVVYALVAAILVPCVATIAMLGHELGWRRAGAISAGTVATALVVGGAIAHLLPLM
jgi:ferrous iron transport protein B